MEYLIVAWLLFMGGIVLVTLVSTIYFLFVTVPRAASDPALRKEILKELGDVGGAGSNTPMG